MATPVKNLEMLRRCELVLITGQEREMAPEIAAEFAMTERTVWRYYREVRDNWARDEEEARPARRVEFRKMLMKNLRMAWDDTDPQAGAATLRILARLDGLEAPAKIKLSGGLDIAAMSPAERRDEIERLLAQRCDAKSVDEGDYK